MDESIAGRTVGERIRRYGERAGVSRPVLGGLVGRAAEWSRLSSLATYSRRGCLC